MASFYLDADVSYRVLELLGENEHDAVSCRDFGLAEAPDPDLLLDASKQGRIFLTHNYEHFQNLHLAWCGWSREWGVTPVHHGVLIVPQSPHWDHQTIVRETVAFLDRLLVLSNELYRWHFSMRVSGLRGWHRLRRDGHWEPHP
ncbi:MAG: DUF5615 family PIN-like protein [Chloroflexi bacterium]|nr:DUF5615 family PIN-like protein [Chloroflexota bacterium]